CSISSTFIFSSRRRHTRSKRDWSSDVCSSDLWLLHHLQRRRGPAAGGVCRGHGRAAISPLLASAPGCHLRFALMLSSWIWVRQENPSANSMVSQSLARSRGSSTCSAQASLTSPCPLVKPKLPARAAASRECGPSAVRRG